MQTPPNAAALREALRANGLTCMVEARDGLAVLRTGGAEFAALAARRHEVVALARDQGFTHACLELGEEG